MFTLEVRQRVNQNANKTVSVLGVFSKAAKAKKYAMEHGESYIENKGTFFAVCETWMDTGDVFFVEAFDANGKETYLFAKHDPPIYVLGRKNKW